MMTSRPRRPLLRDIAPFSLRIEDDLREQLQTSADRNGRSLSAEIANRLRGSLEAEGRAVTRFETGAAPIVYGSDQRPPLRLPSDIDLDLLQQAIAGAAETLAAREITLPDEKFALLVSLLYSHFASGRPVDAREFARFVALIA